MNKRAKEPKLELCYFFFKLKLITNNCFLIKLEQNSGGKRIFLIDSSKQQQKWKAMACTEKRDQGGVEEDMREGTCGLQERHRNEQVPGRNVPFDPDEEWAGYVALSSVREEDVAQEGWTAEKRFPHSSLIRRNSHRSFPAPASYNTHSTLPAPLSLPT